MVDVSSASLENFIFVFLGLGEVFFQMSYCLEFAERVEGRTFLSHIKIVSLKKKRKKSWVL